MNQYITPERLDAIGKFYDSLQLETDRGCALLATAFLDEELKKLLASSFTGDAKVIDGLLSPAGPIGPFSSRIDFAYALGKISAGLRKDLHLLRKIRNDFGHSPDPITFLASSIADRCMELKHVDSESVSTPREMYVSCVIGALGKIHGILAPAPAVPPPPRRKLALVAAKSPASKNEA
jgi:DNA-binding MltR family transcriptional regulator